MIPSSVLFSRTDQALEDPKIVAQPRGSAIFSVCIDMMGPYASIAETAPSPGTSHNFATAVDYVT